MNIIKTTIIAFGCIGMLSGSATLAYADEQVGIVSGNYAQIFPTAPKRQYTGATHIAEPRPWFSDHNTPVNTTVQTDIALTVPLRVASDVSNACANDTVRYTIGYKNMTTTAITDAAVRVYVPKNIVAKNVSAGDYDAASGIITISIGTMNAGSEGRLSFDGRIVEAKTASTPVVAEFIYNDIRGGHREQTLATLKHEDCKNTSIAALAFMAGSFYPHSFFGWLFLIALAIIIMLLSRKFFYKPMHHGGHSHFEDEGTGIHHK